MKYNENCALKIRMGENYSLIFALTWGAPSLFNYSQLVWIQGNIFSVTCYCFYPTKLIVKLFSLILRITIVST